MRRATDENLQVRRRERFREVVPCPRAQRFDTRRDAWVAGHHDDDGFLMRRERSAKDLHPGNRGHIKVDENDVELPTADELQRFVPAPKGRDIEPVHLEHAGATFAQRSIVIYDEQTQTRLDFCGDRKRVSTSLSVTGERTPRISEYSGRRRHQTSSFRLRRSVRTERTTGSFLIRDVLSCKGPEPVELAHLYDDRGCIHTTKNCCH